MYNQELVEFENHGYSHSPDSVMPKTLASMMIVVRLRVRVILQFVTQEKFSLAIIFITINATKLCFHRQH